MQSIFSFYATHNEDEVYVHSCASLYVLPGRKGLSQFLSKQDESSSCKTCCQFDGKAKEFVCAFQQTYSLVGWLVCLF